MLTSSPPKIVKRRARRVVLWIVCAILAAASLLVLLFVLAFWQEARRSEIGRAFGIYVVRSIQSARNGVISGESNFWQSGNVPVWVDGTNDPFAVNCDIELSFPPIVEDSIGKNVFRSERVIIVGPNNFSYFGFGVVTAIYEGQVEDFAEINSDAALINLFSSGGEAEQPVESPLSTKKPQIERTDKAHLYRSALMGRNISVVSKNCEDFSYSIFRF